MKKNYFKTFVVLQIVFCCFATLQFSIIGMFFELNAMVTKNDQVVKYELFEYKDLSYLTNCKFEGCVFRGLNSSNFYHSGSENNLFTGCLFEQGEIKNKYVKELLSDQSVFLDFVIEGVSFYRSRFLASRFERSTLKNCVFYQCDLRQTDFSNSNTIQLVFLDSIIDDATFETLPQETIIGFDGLESAAQDHMQLKGHLFRDIRFGNTNFKHLQFIDSTFDMCKFDETTLSWGVFDGVDITFTEFENLKADHLVVSNSVLEKVTAKNINFRKSEFKGTIIKDSTFIKCNFDRTNWEGIIIKDTNFIDCTFKHAVTANVKLVNTYKFFNR